MRLRTLIPLVLLTCGLAALPVFAFPDVECGTTGAQGTIASGTQHLYQSYETYEEAEAAMEAFNVTDTMNALRTYLPAGQDLCEECYDLWQCWENLVHSSPDATVGVGLDHVTGLFWVVITFKEDGWVALECTPCVMCGECGDETGD